MKIGYACQALGVPQSAMKSCILKNATEVRLMDLTAHNLNALDHLIDYNIEQGISLFRISSDLIPFASHPVNQTPWWQLCSSRLSTIGHKIKQSGMRVSMHPGQYTVLNSPQAEVVSRAIDDLRYHVRMLDSLGVGSEHKIILHIGGIYQNKRISTERFISHFRQLDDSIRCRLVVENDDKAYNIEEVLDIGFRLGVPVIFDNLHHELNPSPAPVSHADWIGLCLSTWNVVDGTPKIHYSQQDPLKKAGSHSATVRVKEFMRFYHSIYDEKLDIMLEVKDKNLSAVKLINCLCLKTIQALEMEWSRYKYSVLECSPQSYAQLRMLLRDKDQYPAIEFYTIIEQALDLPREKGNCINAAQHVWGYFRTRATATERQKFLALLEAYSQSRVSLAIVKAFLRKLAVKYQQSYLLNSYYFVL